MMMSCWDFAGQAVRSVVESSGGRHPVHSPVLRTASQVYYSTHAFFISPAALFCVTVSLARGFEPDTRRGSHPPSIQRVLSWVATVQSKVPDALIVIVGTHLDAVASVELAAQRLKSIVAAVVEWKQELLARLLRMERSCGAAVRAAEQLREVRKRLQRLSVVGACASGARDGQALVTRPGEALFGMADAVGVGVLKPSVSPEQWAARAVRSCEAVQRHTMPAEASDNGVAVPVPWDGQAEDTTVGREVVRGLFRVTMRSVGSWLAELAFSCLPSVGELHPTSYLTLAEVNFAKHLPEPYTRCDEPIVAASSAFSAGHFRLTSLRG